MHRFREAALGGREYGLVKGRVAKQTRRGAALRIITEAAHLQLLLHILQSP